MSEDRQIAALLRERDALTRQGNTERVEQVDAELKARGHEPPATEDAAQERARREAPRGRRTQPQQQTGD